MAKAKFTTGNEKHVVYKKTTKRGEGKVGDIMVNHNSKDKGTYDTISLTRTENAKTIKQGVAAEKKWHKQNSKDNGKKSRVAKKRG
jgi:signal peptidase I